MDNASNNGTLIQEFADLMATDGIEYNADDSWIRCFSHIVNVCAGRVTTKFIELHTDEEHDNDYDDDDRPKNPITKCRKTVQVIRASGQRRDDFADIIIDGNKRGDFTDEKKSTIQLPEWELLHDVKTRWDSLLYMLRRSRILRQVSFFFCTEYMFLTFHSQSMSS
jgi:hypothetical protein